jgi:SNF2 family DNA or RNA helicase
MAKLAGPTPEYTHFHAKYFAWELSRQRSGGDVDRLSHSLFDSTIDLNPHQIDAAIFALRNPLSKGVLLAGEVGLCKTIEAALVLSQFWAERRRRLLIICPASLRKQWANELSDKFHLPTQVLDSRTWRSWQKADVASPLEREVVSIISLNYAARLEDELGANPWDLVVIDEAHKLRNAHRDSHRTGQSLRRSLAGVRKLLVTVTPLQNSLLELYGLSTIIDERLFGDRTSFQRQFMHGGDDIAALRRRLKGFAHRTLRRQVLEYVQYTERRALTVPFEPNPDEQRLYHLVSGYLSRQDSYGFPTRQRHLLRLVMRKLLAPSTSAVIRTLETIHERLVRLRDSQAVDDDWFTRLIDDDDLEEELLEDNDDLASEADSDEKPVAEEPVDIDRLNAEIAEVEQYLHLAHSIPEDAKSHALLKALSAGFKQTDRMAVPRKAVIFTEPRRTQAYLAQFLEGHGYAGKVMSFSGSNQSGAATGIYQQWLQRNAGSDRITGSPAVDRRTALINHFRDEAEILIATEAGAEGINLQFCAQVINYDLPWNPQRVEQRIGRCHHYGQQFDVVVINFLNQKTTPTSVAIAAGQV